MDEFLDKTFYTFRRSKMISEAHFLRWSGLNFFNKHQTRNVDAIQNLLDDQNYVRKVYEARPCLILNVDNEYQTFQMMSKLNGKQNRLTMPRGVRPQPGYSPPETLLQPFCEGHAKVEREGN